MVRVAIQGCIRKAASMKAVMKVQHLFVLLPSQAWLRVSIYLDNNPFAAHGRKIWKKAHEDLASSVC
jgi:hypothetical protein